MLRNINGITYNPPSVTNVNTTYSGTTGETILNSVLIPANTFRRNDGFGIQTRVIKTTTVGSVTVRLRIGPTLNTSQTLAGIFSGSTSSQTYLPFDRRLILPSTINDTRVYPTVISTTTDITSVSVNSISSLSIDWESADNYLIITGQADSTSEVINCPYIITDLLDAKL